MRFASRVATGLVAAATLTSPALAAVEDGYRHGRVRYVEPGVTLQRATEVSAEAAVANLPFLPGDRVWTDAAGRLEFQFPDGTLVRVDSRSKLDYAGHEEGQDERVVLRLWSGSLVARVRTPQAAHFEIETPAGSVELLDQAMVRVDVDAGEARVSVYRGEAVLDDGRGRVRVTAGERTLARWGGAASEPEPFDVAADDDFARWDEARESEERWASRASEYLPAELDPYAGELEQNGSWRYEGSVGYVWTPRVAAGWSPYSNGYWSWTPYGWTWVPYETWGWAPFHYGRWGFSVSYGWYWAPGRVWGPGWVSWGVGGGYVGWCPLGWRDRPVYAWGRSSRGYAVPRRGGHGGWNVVRSGDFSRRDVARRRVPLAGLDPGSLRVAESPSQRPTRDARELRASSQAVRAISRRPTPGDFVRELAVDNKTTIPSPWLRRGRSRSEAVGAREARDPGAAASRRGARPSASATASRSGTQAAAPRETSSPRASGSRSSGSASPGRSGKAPTYQPRAVRPEASRPAESGGRARYRSAPARREDGGSRSRTERSSPPARDSSRAAPSARRAPRVQSRSRPSSSGAAPRASSRERSGSSQRSSGQRSSGQRSSGSQRSSSGRSAPRPQRQPH